MSTTLLNTTADGSPSTSDAFRVALTSGGAVGISCRVTTGGAALTQSNGRPLTQLPMLHLTTSNFTDGAGAGNVPATTRAEFGGAGSRGVDMEVGALANEIRHTEVLFVASGPVMYGYLEFRQQLSADVTIVIEALEL